jgi:hypothetical protein
VSARARRRLRPVCADCEGGAPPAHQRRYDHIHNTVAELPPAWRAEEHLVVHGYAVELAGQGLERTWVFFADLEPALVFGRAGRMSSIDISSYGVFPAARECRYLEGRGDVVTLYTGRDRVDRRDDEAQAFDRWLAGTSRRSSHYQPPPPGTRTRGRT